jgi:hypothetical protein
MQMNRYLLMSAAALLASTGAAGAATHSFTFGTTNGGSYCDGGTITTGLGNGYLATWIHTNNNCASGTSQGTGFLIRVKGLGEVWWMSDNYLAKNDGIYNEYLSYAFQKKIKNGSKWSVWIGLSGYTNFEANSGLLANVTAGAHRVKSRGTASTAASVAKLIAARHR